MRAFVAAALAGFSTGRADYVVQQEMEGLEGGLGGMMDVNIATENELFTASHVHTQSLETRSHTHEDGNTVEYRTYTSSYKSQDIKLKTGEAWFTLPTVTKLPMPSPGGEWAILGATYDIVDDTGRRVPLSEMYSHHWLVYDGVPFGSGTNIGCGGHNSMVSNVFGAGGEMRGMNYNFPPGHGKIYKSNRHWSANIHFIRTEDLSTRHFKGDYGQALKSCIECGFVPGKAISCIPGLVGPAIFACCASRSRCPVNHWLQRSRKTYNLVYNITWTPDVKGIKQMKTFVIDALGCQIVQNLKKGHKNRVGPGGTTCDDKVCVSKVTQHMPESGTIRWAYTHQHEGAINSTMLINGKPHCTSYPHFGTDPHNSVGNEKGYAVGFHMCVDPENATQAVHVNKGDKITVLAHVSIDEDDKRGLPIPGGDHRGFMNLMYFVLTPDVASEFACVDNQCVPKVGGVDKETCSAACGSSEAAFPLDSLV